MLKTVIFDMDGVIVDTEPLHYKAYFQMFNHFGINVTDEIYQTYTGQSTINVCGNLVEHFNMDVDAKELVKVKQQNFINIFKHDDDLTLIDGALELIKDYYNNGLTLILASSASHNTINNVFTRFELDQYFKEKISGSDFKESKPHPSIFLKAAELSNEPVENCIVIEDSTNGIQAAVSANIFCVGFKSLHSKNQNYSKASIVISSFDEVMFDKVKGIV